MVRITDQQILDAYRAALLALATAQSYTVMGRTVTKADIEQIKQTIREYEWRLMVDRSPDDAMGIVQITT